MPETLLQHLTGDEVEAVIRVRDELFPGSCPDAVARKLLRDALVGMDIMRLPKANRSRGARRG